MSCQHQHAARLHKECPPGALRQYQLKPAAAGCLVTTHLSPVPADLRAVPAQKPGRPKTLKAVGHASGTLCGRPQSLLRRPA